MTAVWVLLVVGQVHGVAGKAERQFPTQQVCEAIADDLKRWPQVQSAECIKQWGRS